MSVAGRFLNLMMDDNTSHSQEMADLAATARQMQRFGQWGLLDEVNQHRIQQMITERQQFLRERTRARFRIYCPRSVIRFALQLALLLLVSAVIVVGVHGLRDTAGLSSTFASFTELAGSRETGLTFVGVMVALVALAEFRARRHGAIPASWTVMVCLLSLASMLIVAAPPRALEEPTTAMAVDVVAGVAVLAMNRRRKRPFVTSCAVALLVQATLWACWWIIPERPSAWAAILGAEGIAITLLAWNGAEAWWLSAEALGWLALIACGYTLIAQPACAVDQIVAGCLVSSLFALLGQRRRRLYLVRFAAVFLMPTLGGAISWASGPLPAVQTFTAIVLLAGTLSLLLSIATVWACARTVPSIGPRLWRPEGERHSQNEVLVTGNTSVERSAWDAATVGNRRQRRPFMAKATLELAAMIQFSGVAALVVVCAQGWSMNLLALALLAMAAHVLARGYRAASLG